MSFNVNFNSTSIGALVNGMTLTGTSYDSISGANLTINGATPYSGLTSNTPGTVSMPAALTIATTTGGQQLLMGAYYTEGVNQASAIQSNGVWSGGGVPESLLLNPQGGAVGIGTTSPQYTLDVGTGSIGAYSVTAYSSITSTNGNMSAYDITASGTIYSGGSSTGLLMQGTNGYSYIRALTGSLNLGYGGTNNVAINSSGLSLSSGTISSPSFNSTSDYRIKKDVVTLDDSFTVDNLRPVTYNNTKLEKQDIGLIAHELQEVYPFLVNGEKDGEEMQSVNYTGLISILIKEIQDLKKRVKELEQK